MSEIVYEPWRPDEYPRLTRDVFGIHWNPERGLRMVLTAQNDNNLPGLRIDLNTRVHSRVSMKDIGSQIYPLAQL